MRLWYGRRSFSVWYTIVYGTVISRLRYGGRCKDKVVLWIGITVLG